MIFDYFSGTGTSDNDLYAQVWELQDNRLKITQQLRFNIHLIEPEESFSFDPEGKLLTAKATHYLPGDWHCCISARD